MVVKPKKCWLNDLKSDSGTYNFLNVQVKGGSVIANVPKSKLHILDWNELRNLHELSKLWSPVEVLLVFTLFFLIHPVLKG